MILVTGATGLVGSHLIYSLLQQQETIRATHRKSSDRSSLLTVFSYFTDNPQLLYDKIEWIEADLTDISALEKAFNGIETVYHCAAYVNFNPRNFQKLKKSNVEATANMVNLALDHGVKRFCYVSSIATIGTSIGEQIATEETPWSWEEENNVYAITKHNAEMEVWRASQEGLSVVIVNPGVILGPVIGTKAVEA
ncbi:NAD-dependent epimerase/dehydratase family protein [Aureitalea marina]|uniref:NAD-dependent epimerase/dehydratase family protein n=1 Tax=Aureitalea marina TaxID=930804 RepID=UPI000CF2E69A|nr:NAD-dependent epimerase/dehydratase family protein [Aureitalea marina]